MSPKFLVFAAAGFGFYTLTGELIIGSSMFGEFGGDLKGKFVGNRIFLGCEYKLDESFNLTFQTGMRVAKINKNDVSSGGEDFQASIDYTGLHANVGLGYYFGKKTE